MANWDIATPNTGTALAALDANSVRILWQKTVDIFEQSEDFFQQFEGTSKDMPIRVINDTSKGAGLTLRITTRAGYYGRGKSGDSLFANASDFEPDIISSYQVNVDYLRNATSITQRTDEYMGMQGELANGQAVELGKWMGREKTARLMMTYLLKGGPQNYLIAGGRSTQDNLLSTDTLAWNEILNMGQALKPLGGRPCQVATRNGNPVMKYCVIGTTAGLFGLKQDSVYRQILRESAPRESAFDENPLYQGGYAEVDGHSIREYNPVDHDGYGPIGSAYNPKAFLGGAITAGTSTFAVLGGGSAAAAAYTNIDFFRYFPNFAFEFLPSDVYSPGSTTQYLLIVNPINAAIDPGKIGMYAYTTGNNGNQITITQRLGAVSVGACVTTLGSVTYNSGVWAGLHTTNHPIGATVLLCNAKGVPIGQTLMTGAESVVRGYGSMRNKRSQWLVDGEFETRKYITSVFGQALRKNVRGVYPGFSILTHAVPYPELRLPAVTS
jgi:hypothetical protein